MSDKADEHGPQPCPLTPAEIAVLRAMETHGSQKQAAKALGLSRHTVHRQLADIREKLGVETSAQAGDVAIRHGWI